MAPDAHAIQVDPWIALAQILEAGDLVGQRVVAHVGEPGVVEGLGTPRRTHAVDGHHDEAQLGQRLVVAVTGEEAAPTYRAGLRTRVDVVDHRVLFRRIEVGRLEHHAVQIGLAITRLDDDRHRRHPAGSFQSRDIRLRDVGDGMAVLRAAQYRHRRLGRRGPGVHEQLVIRRQVDRVVGRFRCQQDWLPAVEADFP
jgi:hypothetical protein